MGRLIKLLASLCLLASAPLANAMTAAEIHARIAPAVFPLELLDADGNTITRRSAVQVTATRLITQCEGLENAVRLQLEGAAGMRAVQLLARDDEHRLCLLEADSTAGATPLAIDTPLLAGAGSRVYAIASTQDFGVGIADGVIAGIRHGRDGPSIQFTAPLTRSAAGGALVDEHGRLIGIIDDPSYGGHNVSFAQPVTLLSGLESRAAARAADHARSSRAGEFIRNGNWDALEAMSAEWTAADPRSTRACAFHARAAAERGDWPNAEIRWRKLLALQPDSRPALAGLVVSLLRQQRRDEALATSTAALAGNDGDADLLQLHAGMLAAAGRTNEAEAAYRQVVERDPWQIGAWAGLAALAGQRGDHDAAVHIWARIGGLLPEDPRVRLALVEALLKADQPQRAWRNLARLPEAIAGTPAAIRLRALTLQRLGRTRDAVALLRDAGANAGDAGQRADALLTLSILYAKQQRWPQAIQAAGAAVALQPENDQARFWQAVHLKDGGRPQEALVITSDLIVRQAADVNAWRQHGFVLAILDRQAEAIPALRKSLQFDPRQTKVWGALIEALHAAGDRDGVRKACVTMREVDAAKADESCTGLMTLYQALPQ